MNISWLDRGPRVEAAPAAREGADAWESLKAECPSAQTDADAGHKAYRAGTHRTVAPPETLARVRLLMPTMGITRIANITGLDRVGIPVVMVCRPNSRSIAVSQGKGLTLEAAKASGLMEAVETFHAENITRPLILGTARELDRSHALANIDQLPRAMASRFGPDEPILWIEGHDVLGGSSRWLPYEFVHTDYTLPPGPASGCFPANTNGLASGNHLLEAVSHGVCEVIERDATTLWMQGGERFRRGRVLRLESADDGACQDLLERFTRARVAVRVWDTTSDVGVASFYCLVMGRDDGFVDPEFGGGCHPARQVALLRALTEAAQARTTYIAGSRDDFARDDYSVTGSIPPPAPVPDADGYGRRRAGFPGCPDLRIGHAARGCGVGLAPPPVSGHPTGAGRRPDQARARASRGPRGGPRPGGAGQGRPRRLCAGTSRARGSTG